MRTPLVSIALVPQVGSEVLNGDLERPADSAVPLIWSEQDAPCLPARQNHSVAALDKIAVLISRSRSTSALPELPDLSASV